MKARFLAFWQQREPRERWLLGGGAGLLTFALLFLLVWEPLLEDRKRLQTRVPQLAASARLVEQDAAEVERLKAAPRPPASTQGLQKAIEQSASARNVRDKVTRISPEGADRMRVTLNEVSFEQWLGWVARLQTEQRVRIEAAQVDALAEPGMVKVNAVFASALAK